MTILFADIVGFTSLSERLDAEDVRDLTTECFRRLVAEATIFGGMVDKFIGDAVMVLFGAPSAHEDDPLRAARAALAMQSALERFNAEIEPVRGFRLALRIGIESGEVVTGLRDVNGVHEYTAIGDAVNVAARLQSATEPRTVMIGPNTERHVRRMLRLTPVEPLHLKGKSEPILAWLVEGFPENAPPTKREGSSPFVGRSEEMATFLNRLNDLRRGHGQVLAIIGDPGLGKSRLVAEAQASAEDLIWWRAATSAHEESSSHAVMRSVLSQICLPDGVIEQNADEVILERFGALGFADHVPLIARVLGLSSAAHGRDVASGTSAAEAAQLTISAISKLLEELTVDRPSVLEIDDLHWADPSSVQLLCELLSVTERIPLLLCLVFRPERDAPIWQLRERAARYLPHRYTEIQLQPLTRKAASDLAAGLIGTHELPESLNELLDRAAGTPLWLEELVHTLQDQGIVVPGGDQPVSANVDRLEIPDSLQGLIVARLDRLGDARGAVQTASVIGRRFGQRVLERISSDPALDDHLVQAQRADIVRELAVIPEREYGFKHVLVQEAAYSTLLMRRRRELHGLVAEVLTELYADRLETMHPTLAFHYERAQLWDQALDHSVAAAEAARASFANREALTHYSGALGLLQHVSCPPDRRMRLLRRRAEVENDLGDFDAARADLEAARAISSDLNDLVSEAQIVGALAMLWSGHRDYEEGLRLAQTAVQIAQAADSPRDLAQAQVRVATALLNLNRETSCRESLEAALTIFRSLGDEDGEAQTLDLLGMISFVFGRMQIAQQYSEEAIDRLRATGDRWTEASSAIVHGISIAILGDMEGGERWVEYALATWTEIDSVSGISFAYGCLAQCLEPYGKFQAALEYAQKGLDIARRIDHLEWQCIGLWQLGRVHRACGLFDDSAGYLREMVQVAASLQSTLWIAMGTGELGATLSHLKDQDEARRLLEEALRLGSGTDWATFQASIHNARLTLERGEHQAAYEQARRISGHAGGLEVLALDASLVEGLALCEMGNVNAGIEVLRTSLERARSWGVKPAAWRLHLSLSRVLDDQGNGGATVQEARSAQELIEGTLAEISDEKLRSGLQSSEVLREAQRLARADQI